MGRTRWVGAAIAAALAAAGAVSWAFAAGSDRTASSFVPITPCRLFDTRPGSDNVGTKATPLGPGDTFVQRVWGQNGKCTIPSGATAVSMNVAIVNPTAASFLTVYPDGVDRPLAASQNWVAAQAPTPNAVTAALSSEGKLAFYNLTGTVDLAVDVVGYYVAAATGPGATGPAGPAGPTGPIGPEGPIGPPGTPSLAGPHHGRRIISTSWTGLTNAGAPPALTLRADGTPVIATHQTGGTDLAICADAACLDASITRGDAVTTTGYQAAGTTGLDGIPVFVTRDIQARSLKFVRCTTAACSATAATTLAIGGDIGAAPSIAIGADGLPLIVHIDAAQHLVFALHCTNPACGQATSHSIASFTGTVPATAIAIGADGTPFVAIAVNIDNATAKVMALHCTNASCDAGATATDLTASGQKVGGSVSVAIGAAGRPLVSYQDANHLVVTDCANVACSASTAHVVDATASVGDQSSLAIGPEGDPVVAYHQAGTRHLAVALCNDPLCAGGDETIVVVPDDDPDAGQYPSLRIGLDGEPLIATYTGALGWISLVKFGHASWVPNDWGQ